MNEIDNHCHVDQRRDCSLKNRQKIGRTVATLQQDISVDERLISLRGMLESYLEL